MWKMWDRRNFHETSHWPFFWFHLQLCHHLSKRLQAAHLLQLLPQQLLVYVSDVSGLLDNTLSKIPPQSSKSPKSRIIHKTEIDKQRVTSKKLRNYPCCKIYKQSPNSWNLQCAENKKSVIKFSQWNLKYLLQWTLLSIYKNPDHIHMTSVNNLPLMAHLKEKLYVLLAFLQISVHVYKVEIKNTRTDIRVKALI